LTASVSSVEEPTFTWQAEEIVLTMILTRRIDTPRSVHPTEPAEGRKDLDLPGASNAS